MMKGFRLHIILLLTLTMLVGMIGCAVDSRQKNYSKRQSLWRNDKIAYGTYLSRQWLPHLFPDAEFYNVSRSPAEYYLSEYLDEYMERRLTISISKHFHPNALEWTNVMNVVGSGEVFFIAASDISERVLDSLRLQIEQPLSPYQSDSASYEIWDFREEKWKKYSYPGTRSGVHISDMDSTITNILGYDHDGAPNFVRINYESGGAIYLHTDPMAFTNGFLLHENNRTYYELAFSDIDKTTPVVYWNDYFRTHRNGVVDNFSSLQVVWKSAPLRWSLISVLLIFALLYIFESRRKESPLIPLPAKRNTSLDYVKTVAALYFQQHDNKNTAEKMVHQFAEFIQRNYLLRLQSGDRGLVAALAGKTGLSEAHVENTLYLIKMVRDYPVVSDELLSDTYHALEKFYKKEKYG